MLYQIADRAIISGAIGVERFSDSIDLGTDNAAIINVVAVEMDAGGDISFSFVGSNSKLTNFVSTGPAPATLSTTGAVGSLDLGATGWRFVRIKFTSSAGKNCYSATLATYRR